MGTGNIGDKNITQEEMKRDVELNKPYWFVADSDGGFISVVFPGVSSMMKIESKIEVDEDVRTPVVIKPSRFHPICGLETHRWILCFA